MTNDAFPVFTSLSRLFEAIAGVWRFVSYSEMAMIDTGCLFRPLIKPQ
jgi:hypothetical protein